MSKAVVPADVQTLLAHREWVRRVARALVADPGAADDLEQDLWVEVLERPPRAHTSLRGWLATALRHRFLNARRSERRRVRHEVAASRTEAVPPEGVVEEADVHRSVVNAVMELDEPYRSTVLLRFFRDLPPAAIARQTGVPAETVRTRVRRALALLRERLGAKAEGGPSAWCAALAPLLTHRTMDAASPHGAAAAGGSVMANKLAISASAAALLVAGGGMAWTVAQRAHDVARLEASETAARAAREDAEKLAAEVKQLRDEVGVRDAGRSGRRADPAPTTLRAAIDDQAARLAALETSVAGLTAGPAGPAGASAVRSPERRKKALEELLAIDDPEKRVTIRRLVDELVRYGDEVVPDVQAALDSGSDRAFYDRHSVGLSAGIVTGWPGRRTILYDVLQEIETPAADAALLEAVGRAHRLWDYADLLTFRGSTRRPAVAEGIRALLPAMLASIAEAGGPEKADQQASLFSDRVARQVTYYKATEAAGALEELLRKAATQPGGLSYAYRELLSALVEVAPDAAARVVLAARRQDREHDSVAALSDWVEGRSFRPLVAFYEAVLAQGDLDANARRRLFESVHFEVWQQSEGRRIEDAPTLAAFLEARSAQETDANVRKEIDARLAELRTSIERAREQQ